MNEKRFRFDLFVAVCALVLSGIAAGASAYQTYVINQQYQASIWPYLDFSATSGSGESSGAGSGELSLIVKNYGLGPALIRSFEITRDGKAINAFSDLHFEKPNGRATVTTTFLGPGSIIQASESVPLVVVQKGPDIVKRIVAAQRSLGLSICYCSLLGRCWIRRIPDPTDQPVDVRACPLPRVQRTQLFSP